MADKLVAEFKPEFKVRLEGNVAHVPCIAEHKANGSITMHAPSPKATQEAVEKFRRENK